MVGSILTANGVREVLLDCFLKQDEIHDNKPRDGVDVVYARGIKLSVGLHRGRLESHREHVKEFLRWLNDSYIVGDCFLNMCNDRNGDLWTGSHRSMDELIVLSLGLGLIEFIISPDEGGTISFFKFSDEFGSEIINNRTRG